MTFLTIIITILRQHRYINDNTRVVKSLRVSFFVVVLLQTVLVVLNHSNNYENYSWIVFSFNVLDSKNAVQLR